MSVPFWDKARASKKAKLNTPTDDNSASEPEQIPKQFEPNADTIHDDPPPEHHETFAEPILDDPTGHATDPPSPTKAADKPPSPAKAANDQSDDVIVTGVGHTTPGNPITLSKHSAKEEFSAMDKGKWKVDLNAMPISTPKIFILGF